MLERYSEQEAAVYSAMTDKAVKKNLKNIVALSASDVRLADNVVAPENCDDPYVHRVISVCIHDADDWNDGLEKYGTVWWLQYHCQNSHSKWARAEIHNSTALDPRFKSLLHLDAATRQRVYEALTTEIVVSIEQVGIIYEFKSFYFASVRILNQIILSNVNKYIYI